MEPFERVALYVKHPVFLRWLDNPEEPRDWTGVAQFLGLTGADKQLSPAERLKEIRADGQAAIDWCKAQEVEYVVLGHDLKSPIHVRDLCYLLDFLVSMTYRFPKLLKRRGGDEPEDEHEKPFWDWD
jgi:hypothetical protein